MKSLPRKTRAIIPVLMVFTTLFTSAAAFAFISWETVGAAGFTSGQASYPSLALDGSTPYLAFRDEARSGRATVMKFNGSSWQAVGQAGFTPAGAKYLSLAMYGSTPYVAFGNEAMGNRLTVMKFNGSSWEYIGSPGISAGQAIYISLALDGSTPYVAFKDYANGYSTSVMRYTGSYWEYVGEPGFGDGATEYISLALDGSTLYVGYRENYNGSRATVMTFNGSNWEPVGYTCFSAGTTQYLSLALDGSTPYVAYKDWGYEYKATVMTFNGSNWVPVGSPGFTGHQANYISLAMDGSTPYIAFTDAANGSKVSVMRFNGSAWDYVGSPGISTSTGYYSSLALHGDKPYVAFMDTARGYKATVMAYGLPTPPVLNSFLRQSPADTQTNADTLVFRATFDKDVTNVGTADFEVNGSTTATVSAVDTVSGSIYDVMVSGGDLAGFNGVVGLDLAAGQNITDLEGTPLPAGEPDSDETYTVDNDPPGITSFARQTPAAIPTNADTLVFRATFDEDVKSVGTGDFEVNSTSTATVTGVTPISQSVYDVTVSGGNLAGFNGAAGLNLAEGQDITDLAGNALPAGEPGTDQTYTLDNDAPAITSLQRAPAAWNPTNADTLVFRLTFDEDMANLGTGDFAVNGGTTATVTGVDAVSGTVYDLTVSGGDLADFNGTVGLDLADGQDSTDLAGNSLPAGEPGIDETYTLDNDPPGITSFARQTPADSPTAADTLVFRATFDEEVYSVNAADFAVNGGTTATVTNVTAISGTVYDVTVSGGDLAGFNGTVGLDLDSDSYLTDFAGNLPPLAEPGIDETYLLDNDAPSLTSFTRQTPAASPTNADTLVFRATFDEDVENVGTADFAVDGATTADVTGVTPVNGSVYDVTVSGGDLAGFNGAVGLDLAEGQDITDATGNPLPAGEPGTDQSYTVDNDAPSLTSFTRQTPDSSPTNADTLVFRATFDEDMAGVGTADFAVDGGTTATVTGVVSVSDSVYDVTVSGGDLAGYEGEVGLDLSGAQDLSDLAGNPLPAVEPGTDETYLLDNTPPAVDDHSLGAVMAVELQQITVNFGEAVYDPPGDGDPDDVTNPANYLLVQPGENAVYDTLSVAGGPLGDDVVIPIDQVTYDADTFTATLYVNSGDPLPVGSYRLYVSGTTTILDTAGNPLGGGEDFIFDFNIAPLPATGFPRGVITRLPARAASASYFITGLRLAIPSLGVETGIVGVPMNEVGWDVSWLGGSAGYLAGTAFPTLAGNTALTGHVYTADGLPGPFFNLRSLRWGDKIVIQAWGLKYIYEVRTNYLVRPGDMGPLAHKERDWVTLLTCQGYDQDSGEYFYRRVVQAVLIEVE